MDIFRENNPQCEFLILTGMVTNPKDTYTPAYVEKAYEIAGEEHALVDMYKTHSDILKTKDFISTSGNNINHGNDWLIRVTAQNMLSAMVENFGGERAMQSLSLRPAILLRLKPLPPHPLTSVRPLRPELPLLLLQQTIHRRAAILPFTL